MWLLVYLAQEKANDRLVLKALLGSGASWKVHVGEEKERPSEQWDSSAVVRGLKVDERLRRLKMRENGGIETEKMADTGAEKEAEEPAAADWVRCDACSSWRIVPRSFVIPTVFECTMLDATTCETTEDPWDSSDEVIYTEDNFSNNKRATAASDRDARAKRQTL